MPISSTQLYIMYRDLKSRYFPMNSETPEFNPENSVNSISGDVVSEVTSVLPETSVFTPETQVLSETLILPETQVSHPNSALVELATFMPESNSSQVISEAFQVLPESDSSQVLPDSSESILSNSSPIKTYLLIGAGFALFSGGIMLYLNRQRIKNYWQNTNN